MTAYGDDELKRITLFKLIKRLLRVKRVQFLVDSAHLITIRIIADEQNLEKSSVHTKHGLKKLCPKVVDT